MTVKIAFPYTPGLTVIFYVIDDAAMYLNSGTGLFEAYNAGNEGFYRNQTIAVPGQPGIYGSALPEISTTLLPKRVKVFAYDSADLAKGPIGSGVTQVDKNNNEVNEAQLLNYVFASTVGYNLGVGTNTEEYYGYDGFLAFTTTFDTVGNRSVSLWQG